MLERPGKVEFELLSMHQHAFALVFLAAVSVAQLEFPVAILVRSFILRGCHLSSACSCCIALSVPWTAWQVDTSRYWFNFRHETNALLVYNVLLEAGLPDSHVRHLDEHLAPLFLHKSRQRQSPERVLLRADHSNDCRRPSMQRAKSTAGSVVRGQRIESQLAGMLHVDGLPRGGCDPGGLAKDSQWATRPI